MDAIRFSVVVPVFNNADDLDLCLRCLRAQRYDASRFEIIVVDNGSTDASAAVARSHGVVCLAEREHQSSYAARNRGIERARGTFVAFTDSDCRAHPDWLREIERAAEGDTATGCFAGEILSVEPTTTVERFSDAIGLLRQKGPLSGWHFKPYAQTANAVYRRAVFDRIGLFDPAMRSGGDAAIAWRMQDETTFGLRFVPEAIVYHHHRASVSELWAQFRRYGGGKMSWAQSQAGYTPPAIASLEAEIVGLIERHLADREAAGASEADEIFPLLRIATQMAHLSGYLQDARRPGLRDAKASPVPSPRRRAECDVCGSDRFVPGPNGRLADGLPPQCADCGSLERHRAIHAVLARLHQDADRYPCRVTGEAAFLTSLARSRLRLRLLDGDDKASRETCAISVVCEPGITLLSDDSFSRLTKAVQTLSPEGALLVLVGPNHSTELSVLRALLPNAEVDVVHTVDAATETSSAVLLAQQCGTSASHPRVRMIRRTQTDG